MQDFGKRSGEIYPKIGLALSGGSRRAITHIGVLEVLTENQIPIDSIAACSSGTLVASSFACGSMSLLKDMLLKFDTPSLLEALKLSKEGGGVFNMEKAEEEIFRQITCGKKFEDVKPTMSFVACDLDTGESVSLNLGDLARACRISCSVPPLFSPVRWGNRLLVDGGFVNIVPVQETRDMGADIVIGVDIAATRNIIRQRYLAMWQGLRFLKKTPPFQIFNRIIATVDKFYENSLKIVFYNQSDFIENRDLQNPDVFTVVGKAMAVVEERRKKADANESACDIMLAPNVKHFGWLGVGKSVQMLAEGRRAAREALPEIRRLIQNYQWKKQSKNANNRS